MGRSEISAKRRGESKGKVKMRRCKWKKCVHNTNYAMAYLPKNSKKKKSLNRKVYRAELNVAKLDACISKAITLVALVCTLKEKAYMIYKSILKWFIRAIAIICGPWKKRRFPKRVESIVSNAPSEKNIFQNIYLFYTNLLSSLKWLHSRMVSN